MLLRWEPYGAISESIILTSYELPCIENKLTVIKLTDHLQLNIAETAFNEYRILDLSGKIVDSGENPPYGKMPVTKLPSGIYLLIIVSDKKLPYYSKFTS